MTWKNLARLLAVLDMQFIFMTGTVPRDYVKLYFQLLERKDFDIFRLPSDRPNISLHHLPGYRHASKTYFHQDVALRLTKDLTEESSASQGVPGRPERILIFFPNTETIQPFAEDNGYLWYHSKEGTKLTLHEVLEAWQSGPCNVLVASTSMANGMDVEGVRYVIVVDVHYGVSTLAQMIGRAGRDDLPSAAYFIGHGDPTDLNLFDVPATKCLRRIMMEHLDGDPYAFSCSDAPDKVQPCGVCDPSSRAHQVGLGALAVTKEAAARVAECIKNIKAQQAATSGHLQSIQVRAHKPASVAPRPSLGVSQSQNVRAAIPRNASPGPSHIRQKVLSAAPLLSHPSTGSSAYWSADAGVVSQETMRIWDRAKTGQDQDRGVAAADKGKVCHSQSFVLVLAS